MGMDLKPINPSPDAPRDCNGEIKWGRYFFSEYARILRECVCGGVDITGCECMNDGAIIPEKVCVGIGEFIQNNIKFLYPDDPEEQEYNLEKAKMWKTCGGYEQW